MGQATYLLTPHEFFAQKEPLNPHDRRRMDYEWAVRQAVAIDLAAQIVVVIRARPIAVCGLIYLTNR
jgi:hypothetical protein